MKVFAKRFWGFDPVRWPIISFGLEGNRDALIRESSPGDLIAFIGTKGEPTLPEEQGRFLGLAEIGRIPVDSLEVIDPANTRPYDYENGRFKWPKAAPMLRAWRFPEKPRVVDTLSEQLTYEATVRAVLLDSGNRSAVLALATDEVALPDLEIFRRHRELADALARNGPTRGPQPSSWTGTVTRDASAAATTYALRFGRRDIWKIGHAQDVGGRLKEVNKHVPHEALGEHWFVVLTQRWPNHKAAYDMEQRLLQLLAARRTEGERLICSYKHLSEAWVTAMVP